MYTSGKNILSDRLLVVLRAKEDWMEYSRVFKIFGMEAVL